MPNTVNVLLVDDHPENLIAIEAVLEGLGQPLIKATSGTEALKCLLHYDVAVILLDVQMPGMDGFETATLIRQRERSRHIPIIFLTAFSTSDSMMFKGYSLGAVDYLLKPIDPAILTSKVSVFVELSKKTSEVQRQAAQLMVMNQELRRSEEQFRSLGACSPIGIFLTDVQGRSTYTNPRCQSIGGWQEEEALGTEWLTAVYPEDRDRTGADWSRYLREGGEYFGECRFQQANGPLRWTQVRACPIMSNYGSVIGHVGTIEDITERKLADAIHTQMLQEQAARQEAERANRMKDEFLGVLSHELRTPLNAILGWATWLLSREINPETARPALEAIERNARSQANLIEEILVLSRIVQGQLCLHRCPVDLIALTEAVVATVQPSAATKEVALNLTLASAPDASLSSTLYPPTLTVFADPERLRHIIRNLLANAIKFTPAGGTVTVHLEPILQPITQQPPSPAQLAGSPHPPSSPSSGAWARLSVIDTGIGIKPEFLPYVFDRFRQADSTSTRSYGGLGVGLAIASALVTLHDGTLEATSAGEGQGATFTIQLPLFMPVVEVDERSGVVEESRSAPPRD